jgi:aspartyl-tRNA(Asn)/glutamyl-tRNA(Gln) amidotransferase subunit C
MKISREEVTHVAQLARLELDDEALEQFSRQLGTILEYVEKLNQVDTGGVVPTSHAISLTNAFRDDEGHDHLSTDEALANAPDKDDGGFLVPKVIT